MLSTNPFEDDKLREECGIFGVWGAESATAVVALGLHALQHRGQEAAGITSWDGTRFHSHRAMGMWLAILIAMRLSAAYPVMLRAAMSVIQQLGKHRCAMCNRSSPILRLVALPLPIMATFQTR